MTQPSPTPNDREHIADLVCADIQERKRVGIERYSTALQAGNGRDALLDAYEEALDKVQYLKQTLVERREERAAMAALVEALPKCAWGCGRPAMGAEVCEGNAPACEEHACKRLGGAHFTEFEYAEPLRGMMKLMAGWPKETT